MALIIGFAIGGFNTPAISQTINGTPAIASYHARGFCLDVRSSDKAVLLWACHGGTNQAFRFVSGNYGMISLGNNQCLTSGLINGALSAQNCTNATNQKWGFQANGTLRNEIGLCADIEGGSYSSGARILGWNCTASSNQRFYPAIVANSAYIGLTSVALLGSKSDVKAFLSSNSFSGGNIVAGGAGNIVAGGAGNIIAAGGAKIVAGGAGNIIAAGAGNIIAAGGGNIVAGGAGNLLPKNWSFFSGEGGSLTVTQQQN